MTNLVNCLNALISSHKTTPSGLAKDMGVSPPIITRILNGERLPSHETVHLMIERAAKNPSEAREIIRAHMLDELERIHGSSVASVIIGDPSANPENEHLVASLLNAANSFDEARDLLQMVVELAERQSKRARVAAGSTHKKIIHYADVAEPHGKVAENSPEKKKPR